MVNTSAHTQRVFLAISRQGLWLALAGALLLALGAPARAAALTTTVNTTNVSCNGRADGTATANPSGGTPPYTYQWSSEQTTKTATGLSAGTYTVTVHDSEGADAVGTRTITQPSGITFDNPTTSPPYGSANNGSITATASGGTWPYTYSWSPSGVTSATANNLGPGTHTVTVIDGNACPKTQSFTLNAANPSVQSNVMPADGTYLLGQTLNFKLNFNAPINVTGTPRIPLTIGSATRHAAYKSGSGSNQLTFDYTVQEGDVDTDGITVGPDIELNGGTLFSGALAAELGFTAINLPAVKVYAPAPTSPGSPTIGMAMAGPGQATVTFTAPDNNGGSAITSYTVTASNGTTGSGPSSPITVTGLSNGTSYTFTVTATNAIGTSTASGQSNSVTPKGNQSIAFTNPGTQNFGTSPTLTATAPGGAATFTSSTTAVCTITSGGALTFLTVGTCTINADQAGNDSYLPAGQESRSFAVNAVTTAAGSVPGMVGVATATLSGGGATCTLDPLVSGFAGTVSHPVPGGQTMAYGEFAFQAVGCSASATITLVYPEPLPAGVQLWKYGPQTAAVDGVVAPSTWFPWDGATLLADGKTVIYTVIDNGVGDSDAAVGRIRDPVAVALAGPGAPGGAVGIPVDAPWALALLSALLGGLAWRRAMAHA